MFRCTNDNSCSRFKDRRFNNNQSCEQSRNSCEDIHSRSNKSSQNHNRCDERSNNSSYWSSDFFQCVFHGNEHKCSSSMIPPSPDYCKTSSEPSYNHSSQYKFELENIQQKNEELQKTINNIKQKEESQSLVKTEFMLAVQNNDLICPIGCQIMFFPVKTNCNHTFDKTQIENWLKTNTTCPICRTAITTVELTKNKVVYDALQIAKIIIKNPNNNNDTIKKLRLIQEFDDNNDELMIDFNTYRLINLF